MFLPAVGQKVCGVYDYPGGLRQSVNVITLFRSLARPSTRNGIVLGTTYGSYRVRRSVQHARWCATKNGSWLLLTLRLDGMRLLRPE